MKSAKDETGQGGYPDIADIHDEQDANEAPEASEPATLDSLTKAIRKQPLHKHIYRTLLERLREELDTVQAEAFIAGLPEFQYAVQPEARFLDVLERAGGIERIGTIADADEVAADVGEDAFVESEGEVVEDEAALDAEELAQLAAERAFRHAIWKTTELGEQYLAASAPAMRIALLLDAEPDRIQGYLAVLAHCAQAPRTLAQIIDELERRKAEGEDLPSIHPSIYVDRLEEVGAITWQEAWTLTQEGRSFLADSQAS